MDGTARRTILPTVEEYLELEATSIYRHEYVNGHLYAMGDSTIRHNAIVINVAAHFRMASRGAACRAYAIEIILAVSDSRFYYPDVVVTSNARLLHGQAVIDPCVIVEVLSPHTQQIDTREKLFAYTAIGTLRAYYIVHQDRMTVENHWRDEDGNWWHGTLHAVGTLHVPCLAIDLPLADIYDGVTFDDK
jgi:Uma2 family endonuclease